MNPLFHDNFSISDSLKFVRKSVLIYETIIDSTSLKVNITGDVTPFIDTVTWTSSLNYEFNVVLMKGDIVVDSYHVYTPKIYLNQKFECSANFYGLDNSEDYSLHITSY